jgi:hypothetical protein
MNIKTIVNAICTAIDLEIDYSQILLIKPTCNLTMDIEEKFWKKIVWQI